VVFRVDPLEYSMRTVDNRLVVRVFNPTDDAIELVGPRCSVVDPDGQSHPLRTQSIAPGSFIKLIFPRRARRLYDYGRRSASGSAITPMPPTVAALGLRSLRLRLRPALPGRLRRERRVLLGLAWATRAKSALS
jgi:hypothetical protein